MLVLLALLATGATAVFAVRALTFSRVRFAANLRQVDGYGFVVSDPRSADSDDEDRRGPAALIGAALAARSTSVDLIATRRLLASAGVYSTSPETLVGLRVLGATLFPLTLVFLTVVAGASPALVVVIGIIAAILGWRMPWVSLERRATARADAIDRELPDLIDLLVVTVEAGLGFSQSLQMASERLRDPLGSELRQTLREQQMGRSVEEALEALLERCDTPSMRAFVRSTMRGETLGVSIGAILRNLAVDMRRIRRQRAEEQIQKAPIKMLFPLVFLIFPAIFVVLLAPALFDVLDAFG